MWLKSIITTNETFFLCQCGLKRKTKMLDAKTLSNDIGEPILLVHYLFWMLPPDHKRNTSFLATPIFYVTKI
jgi:hypothetical protein